MTICVRCGKKLVESSPQENSEKNLQDNDYGMCSTCILFAETCSEESLEDDLDNKK